MQEFVHQQYHPKGPPKSIFEKCGKKTRLPWFSPTYPGVTCGIRPCWHKSSRAAAKVTYLKRPFEAESKHVGHRELLSKRPLPLQWLIDHEASSCCTTLVEVPGHRWWFAWFRPFFNYGFIMQGEIFHGNCRRPPRGWLFGWPFRGFDLQQWSWNMAIFHLRKAKKMKSFY